jgi:hypothetical protein
VENSPYLWVFAFPEGTWWSPQQIQEFHPEQSAADFARHDLPNWLRSKLGSRAAIALSGTGSGAQLALKITFQNPVEFPIVAAFDAAIDLFEIYGTGTSLDRYYTDREVLRQQSAYLFLQSYPWPEGIWIAYSKESLWHRGNDRLHEKMNVMGIPHEIIERSGAIKEGYDGTLVLSYERFLSQHLSKPPRMKLL